MNKELQSIILNRDARGINSTILLAKTNKTKANIYNIYFLDDNKELKLLFHSADLSAIKNALTCIDGANNRSNLSYWLLGYRLNYIKFVNLSE